MYITVAFTKIKPIIEVEYVQFLSCLMTKIYNVTAHIIDMSGFYLIDGVAL